MWWGYPHPMPWFGMFLGPIMMLGIMLVCAMVMIFIMRSRGMAMPWNSVRNSDAFDILRQRFASGEIDQTEYEERKRVLSQM